MLLVIVKSQDFLPVILTGLMEMTWSKNATTFEPAEYSLAY